MTKSILFYTFSLIAFAGSAQGLLTPSSDAFEKKWIKDISYEMIWLAVQDTLQSEIGKVSTKIISDKSNLTVVTQVYLNNINVNWIDSTIANIATLKPVRHSSYNMQRDMVLNFEEVVTGYYHDKVKNQKIIINETPSGNYFDSNLYPLLIGWLPLTENFTLDLAIYDYNPAGKIGIIKASVKHVESDVLQTKKNGIRKVWRVTVADEISAGSTSTYFFDKESRRLWKQEIAAGGRKMVMELVE